MNDGGRVAIANDVGTGRLSLMKKLALARENEFSCANAWITTTFLVTRFAKVVTETWL